MLVGRGYDCGRCPVASSKSSTRWRPIRRRSAVASPRFHVEPGDVPADVAARRLGLGVTAFKEALPDLYRRGFPAPDPTTGNFDLQAIDEWRRSRHASGTSVARRSGGADFGDRLARL
jgi:hypothetical protein